MRTLEHVVLSSRHPPNPTQRDPLNFIAPSPPYTLLLSEAEICISDHTRRGGNPSPPPSEKRKWPQRDKLPDDWRPSPLAPVRTSRGFRAGQAFELPFVPRLINFRGRHNPPPPFEGERKYVAMRKRGRRRRRKGEGRREESSPLGKRREHE